MKGRNYKRSRCVVNTVDYSEEGFVKISKKHYNELSFKANLLDILKRFGYFRRDCAALKVLLKHTRDMHKLMYTPLHQPSKPVSYEEHVKRR